MKIIKFNKWHIDLTKNKRKLEEISQFIPIFFEDEYKEKKTIINSIINIQNNLNIKKIFARNCILKTVSVQEKNEFLIKNHLQGKDNSSVRLGLYFNNTLVSIMTLGKSRFNKNYEYEILRYCSTLNTRVTGGFSKLENFFIKNYNPKSIITFADKRFSKGNVYIKNNYTLLRSSPPNYFYYLPDIKKRLSRNQFQKHKLHKVLKNFDPNKTEWENMRINGYLRIYDLGNLCFIKEFNKCGYIK